MKTTFYTVLSVIAFFSVSILGAQERMLNGSVVDENGETLIGATIVVKETNKNAVTDFEGNFSIEAEQGQTLEVRYIGYDPLEYEVGAENDIELVMGSTELFIGEVVVVGYGSRSKRNLSDNISSVGSEDIEGIPTPSVFNTLSGKAAGVQINQNNGKVGSGLNIRIRGQSSISAGTQPLYVIDGVPVNNTEEDFGGRSSNPLISIPASEIESIDILKDASSASIYGSRGANGVVLITTKRGQEGRASFNFNASYGISEASNTLDWLNAEQYIELFTEAAENSGFLNFALARFDRYALGTDWRNGEIDTDWQDLVFRQGSTQDYNFSVSGGTSSTNYYISAGYNNTEGIIVGNNLERLNLRTNLEHKFSDRFTVGTNYSYSRTAIDEVANDNAFVTPLQAIAQTPISPAYLLDDPDEPNPGTLYPNFLLQDKYAEDNMSINRQIGKLYGRFEIVPSLTLSSDLGFDFLDQSRYYYVGRLAPFQSTNGYGLANDVKTEGYIWSNYLTFDKELSKSTHLNVVGGIEYQKNEVEEVFVEGEQFPSDQLSNISSAAEIVGGGRRISPYNFYAQFGRATATIANKYIVKASVRREGSSRFGSNNRYGVFPAVSAAWVLSEEAFLKNNNTLSFLKLRASYGETGNANIGNFRSLTLFQGASYNQLSGLTITQAGNPDLSWETTKTTDIGLEFGLFDYRISGDVAYYNKETEDLLFNVPLPGTSGNPNGQDIASNVGSMVNQGIEFNITLRNIVSPTFNWTTSFNIARNNNEVKELPGGTDVILNGGRNILREGESVNSFYLIEFAGADPDNGDALYYINSDENSRETTNSPTEAERILAGNPFPDLIAGLTNELSYKDLTLSFTFSGEWGASIYNLGGRFQSASADWFDNQTLDQFTDRWRQPGDVTDVPQARLAGGNGTAHSTRYLQENDFIRLRNLTLAYNLKTSGLERIGVSNLRVYASGFNLLTITDYEGYDPESRSDVLNADNVSVGQAFGQDFYSAPAPRTYSLGINLTF